MRFSKQKVEEIKSKADIIDYAKKYFPDLESAGLNKWRVKCCFHNDNDPSLFFYSEGQNYYCFGCQKSGDVFDLVAHFEKCDFQTAVNKVAQDLHLNFEPTGSAAVDYSFSDLKELRSAPLPAKEYLYGRGLSFKILETFGVKYSPHLKAIAFPIFLSNKNQNPDYYFFRCISPYGLRYLIPPGAIKKPFNFFQALKEIQSTNVNDLFIFEGVFDCLAFLQLHQDEKVTALALCGLAVSDVDVIETLLMSSATMQFSKIVWCLDNDESGHNAQLDLAFKFIKNRIGRNYFYAGDYNGYKDYAATLEDKSFHESITTDLLLSAVDYLAYHYGSKNYEFDNDLLAGKEVISPSGEIFENEVYDNGGL